MKEHTTATWRVIPANTPAIIKHCSKCNRKSEYYCSEKFRVNANQSRVDIWLIYKCHKCDTTWKLAIKKGIRPHDVPASLFDQFINNDSQLAWQYAFDKHFLKQNACVVDYTNVEYTVEGNESHSGPQLVHIQSQYGFDLKLGALLAKALGTTVGQIKKHVESGSIQANDDINIMKHKLKAGVEIVVYIGSIISKIMLSDK